jgi:hypothetical protein
MTAVQDDFAFNVVFVWVCVRAVDGTSAMLIRGGDTFPPCGHRVLRCTELWIGPGCGQVCVHRECAACDAWRAKVAESGEEAPVTNRL